MENIKSQKIRVYSYSNRILFVALAVFWSSAEARYNRYQDDVINSMTNWAIEEMSNIPEPYKTRIADKLTEAKKKPWDNVGDYFKYISTTMREFAIEMLSERSKRSADWDSFGETAFDKVQQISEVFSGH